MPRSTRNKIIAGNWKMNTDYAQAMALVDRVIQGTNDESKTQIVLAPPFPFLWPVELQIQLRTNISVAAQNCSDKQKGAFTGEVSAAMLRSIGVESVIIGHSERRTIFKETDEVIAEKVNRALENNLQPIFCCGETLSERQAAHQLDVVFSQLNKGLFHLSAEQAAHVVIAYEPVWAIGTGVNATTEQAEEMHRQIRSFMGQKYGAEVAGGISILYGGSVNSKNAPGLFACPNVDGGLIGGASLIAEEFIAIIGMMEETIESF